MKALIASCDAMQRYLWRRELKRMRWKVVEAKNGREAAELFLVHGDTKLVMVALEMSELDGLWLAAFVRSFPARNAVKVIIVGDDALPQDKAAAIRKNAHVYLRRRVTESSLTMRLRELFLEEDRAHA